MSQKQYQFSGFDNIENIEMYRPGGFHPVSIGDVFANGRYKVLHKLGCGVSSTVWLARDRRPEPSVSDTLVALKVLSADKSSKSKDEIADLVVPSKLNSLASVAHSPTRHNLLTIKDHFMEEGPNGSHLYIISQFAGPSLVSMSHDEFRLVGNKRLRGDLARKVAKQTATVVELMHSAGLVHGDLTSNNILFRVTDQARRLSKSEIYAMLGEPETEEVQTLHGSPPGPQAPWELVAPVFTALYSSSFLEENIVVIDFGQSFELKAPPKGYKASTVIHYFPPEYRFDNVATLASDIWGLACTIFEIRAGRPLFSTYFGAHSEVMRDNILTLGKLPEPWWSIFEEHHKWFEENGEPKPPLKRTSIREKLEKIGAKDMPPVSDYGPMTEAVGTRLEEKELVLLSDMLEKMLKYRPEERITIQEVLQHPWFEYMLESDNREGELMKTIATGSAIARLGREVERTLDNIPIWI